MEKVYMVCDKFDDRSKGTPNIICSGRILREDGAVIGQHGSSSLGWLREDLRSKLDNPSNYEIIDLIEHEVPERFKLTGKQEG